MEGLNSKLIAAARFEKYDSPGFDLTKTDDMNFLENMRAQLDPKWKWKILPDWKIWHNLLEQAESDFKFCNTNNEAMKVFVDTCMEKFKHYLSKKGIQLPALKENVLTQIERDSYIHQSLTSSQVAQPQVYTIVKFQAKQEFWKQEISQLLSDYRKMWYEAIKNA